MLCQRCKHACIEAIDLDKVAERMVVARTYSFLEVRDVPSAQQIVARNHPEPPSPNDGCQRASAQTHTYTNTEAPKSLSKDPNKLGIHVRCKHGASQVITR